MRGRGRGEKLAHFQFVRKAHGGLAKFRWAGFRVTLWVELVAEVTLDRHWRFERRRGSSLRSE